jgi:hypothetical protein
VIDVRWYLISASLRTVKRQLVADAKGSVMTMLTVPSTESAGGRKVEAVGSKGTEASYTFTVNTTRSAFVGDPARAPAAEPTATATAVPPEPDPLISPEP